MFVGCAAYSPGTPTDRERMENEWGDELVQPVGSPAIDPHSDLVWGGLPVGGVLFTRLAHLTDGGRFYIDNRAGLA